jgi:hypothetical protein
VVLAVAWVTSGPPPEQPADRKMAEAEIVRAVDTVLARSGVTPKERRRWAVQVSGAQAVRVAERVKVPMSFPSVLFNKDLSDRIRPYGAHVVATERLKESTVTFHVVRAGVTLRSISCVLTPDF